MIPIVSHTFFMMNEFLSAWKSNCIVIEQFRLEGASGDHLFQPPTCRANLHQIAQGLTRKALNISNSGFSTPLVPCSSV